VVVPFPTTFFSGFRGLFIDPVITSKRVAVRGLGIWTAEMCLIFNQFFLDIFPLDDISVEKAVALNYFAGAQSPSGIRGEALIRFRLRIDLRVCTLFFPGGRASGFRVK
jgi:hypothetical protein